MKEEQSSVDCDLLVAGSGAAGLSAAVTAAHRGLKVLLAEREPLFGGTSASTAGSMWMPGNRLAAERGIEDSSSAVRAYLRALCAERYDEDRIEAFIENAPRALHFLLDHTRLRVFCPDKGSDYHPHLPGSLALGRTLATEPFDGRILGEDLHRLAGPPAVSTFFGIMPALGTEMPHFLRANRCPAAAAYVGWRLFREFCDRMLYGRGTHLTNDAALVGRLLKSALELGVRAWTSAPVTKLLVEDGAVRGAVVGDNTLRSRRGVVLACGGFSHDPSLRTRYFPHVVNTNSYRAATAPGAAGSGLRLGLAAGAAAGETMSSPAGWVPVSLVPRGAGGVEAYPVFRGRGLPGVIAVTRLGRRFANEADPYYDFSLRMIAATQASGEVCAFLVCDSRALRSYGLACVKPSPIPHGRHLRSGYLMRGGTLAELAAAAGIDAAALEETVARFNRDAERGEDPEFGRGTTSYNRYTGDADHEPNPCVAPLDEPPYYAIKLGVGDRGTYVGLATDGDARVLDARRRPVPGLYAAGNDMASVFGGADAGGTMLGQAITFGYVAGNSA
jgi:succinate dehydrogenase/fumarate reductase flavoprotein subunit